MRKKHRLLRIIVITTLLSVVPTPAYADNCSGLSDCFNGYLIPAILLILGLALLVTAPYWWPALFSLLARVAVGAALRAVAIRVAQARLLQPLIRVILRANLRAATSGTITGLTRHGLQQILGRNGRGVSTSAIADAINNAVRTVSQSGDRVRYVGRYAEVVVNKAGEIITAWAKNSGGWRWP